MGQEESTSLPHILGKGSIEIVRDIIEGLCLAASSAVNAVAAHSQPETMSLQDNRNVPL